MGVRTGEGVGEGVVVTIKVGLGEALSMVSGVAVTLGIAVVTGVDDSVAAVSGVRGEVGGTGVEDGVACGVGATSVMPHPTAATKDMSNSIKEKASPFLLRGKARMGGDICCSFTPTRRT